MAGGRTVAMTIPVAASATVARIQAERAGRPDANRPREIVMPPAKNAAPVSKKSAAPAKAAMQATITLKHLAAALSDNHDLPKKQAEAVLGDLVTLTTRHLKKGEKAGLVPPSLSGEGG